MDVNYRKADSDDIEILIRLRVAYLTEDYSGMSEKEQTNIITQLQDYFPKHIGAGFIAWLAEVEGAVVASVFLAVQEVPANTNFITGKTGTILNVFTYPTYRRKGIATELLKRIITEAKAFNLSFIELSATEMGRPLYEKFGFQIEHSHYTKMKLSLSV